MALSLSGIVLVQWLWIRNAFEVQEKLFDRTVTEALNIAVKKLNTESDLQFLTKQIDKEESSKNYRYEFITGNKVTDSLDGDGILIKSSKGEPVYISKADKNLDLFRIKMDEDGITTIVLDSLKKDVMKYHKLTLSKIEDSLKFIVEANLELIEKKSERLDNLIDKISYEVQSFSDDPNRLPDTNEIRKTTYRALIDRGIDLPFEFAVYKNRSDSIPAVSSASFNPSDFQEYYQTSLFPDNILRTSEILTIQFDDRETHIAGMLGWLLAGSALLTFFILMTFGVTTYYILRQKKISDIKSDFINNMTHEFKTPIATINLAVDSVNNPKVIADPAKIRYFTSVIEEENRRMNSQVENILQMALLDRQDLKFAIGKVDIHSLIENETKKLELRVSKTDGEVDLELHAVPNIVNGDETHLRGVISNILDNACKYTIGPPVIRIKSSVANGLFRAEFIDNGIGIRKEDQKKIFEKFFRVSTGNVHNVKGFGLGLSYARAVVEAMGGTISVSSSPGKGSTFTLELKISENEA